MRVTITLVLLLLLFLKTFAAVAAIMPTANYRFDELSYSNRENEVIDNIGGFDGRAQSAHPVPGKICNAVDFSLSGTNDYVVLDENVLTGQTDFSVSVWAKTNKQTNQGILSGSGASFNEMLMWFSSHVEFRPFIKEQSNGDIPIASIADGNWHHLVWTRQGDKSCIYQDKELKGCVTQSTAPLDIQSLILGQEQDSIGGNFDSSQAYNGLIDELLIYRQALSIGDISTLFDNQNAGLNFDGSPRTCPIPPPALLEYRFEEDYWDGSEGEVLDSTDNNNDGKVKYNSTPENISPALTGKLGTCGYASLDDGTIQVTGLPLDTTTNGVKTTVTFWMNWDGTNSTMPIGWNVYDIWLINGSIGFNTGSGDVYGTSSAGLANGWHHIAVEFTNGSVTSNRMYIDGIEQVLTQRQGTPNNNRAFVDSEFRIGGWAINSGYDFHGLIDEVRIYDFSLTASQIATTMAERHTCKTKPIAEYRLDELSYSDVEGEVVDSIGGFDGRAKLTQPIAGKICNALDLSATGIEDYLILDENVLTGQIDFTVSVWAKTNKQTNQIILSGSGRNYNELLMWFNSKSEFRPFLKDRSNGTIPIASIADENWQHLVWTRQDDRSCFYQNKELKGCITQSSASLDIQSLILGQEQDSVGGNFDSLQAYEGLLDELIIYNGALSSDEIATLYENQNAGLNLDGSARVCPTPPVLLSEYRFEENNWDGTEGEILDSTGNNFHGKVRTNSTPENASPALTGSFGTCDYASQNNGSVQVTGLPLDTTTDGVKTTVTFWMNWDGTNNTMPIGWYIHDIWIVNGSIGFNTGNSDVYGTSSAGLANGWHHISAEFTNGSVTNNKLYIDGVKQTLTQRQGTPNKSRAVVDSELRVGGWSRNTSYDFHGFIDEVRVYQGILPTAQVIEVMNERHQCGAIAPDHYEIIHDGQGFTCEAENITIKACANANCDTLYDQETAITLAPSGWSGGDTLVFTGQLTTSLNITDESTVTMAKTAANPEADFYCFNGTTESCDMTFSNDGFEIYGASIGDPLPDQLAANNFENVNVRAVRSVDSVCEALLEGPQEITLSYDCESPNQCLTPLNDIDIAGDDTGESSGNITVVFDAQGVASLGLLNYPDAGRLTLSVAAEIDGVTFENSDKEPVDVYPSYLKLSVAETELLYAGAGNQNNYVAAENFTFVIGAYGTNDKLLRNYQAENPELKVERVSPVTSGENGIFKYSDSGTTISGEGAAFSNAAGLTFSDGEHSYPMAHYTEVGRIEIDVKDANYLGNEVTVADTLVLGDFYPAYFDVALTEIPTLADTCNNTFSYLGQTVDFDTPPEFTVTAYNALGDRTFNYSDTYWNYLPEKPTSTDLSFVDSSTYASVNSASVVYLGDLPVVASNDNYDGSGTVTINNASFRYNKVNPTDNSVFAPVSPFDAQLTMAFTSDFFTSTFIDQNGNEDSICYQASHTNTSCLGWDIEEVTGTQIRYGRLVLESTYGPETESLNVPIKSEYFNADQWLLNTDDSNCTNIDFTETNNEIQLSDTTFANSFNSVTSSGVLLEGIAVGNQFTLEAPNSAGELDIWLDPTATSVTWPTYLNYDWSGDGYINTDDFPRATVTFGLFRGNDRIIHWREVFN